VGAVLVFRDITEKRRAEAKEREAALMAARLAAIVESSQDAIVAKDLNGIVTSWNRGAEALFGYTAEEMVGRRIQILNPLSSPDEMNQILERLRRGDRIERLETIRRTKSGRMVPIELTLSPIRDSRGVIIGASKIARDISARVASEKALAKQASTLARVNSELQQFSYAASHDLREPLRTVAIYSQLLERSAGDRLTEKERDYTMRVITGAHRMGQMVTALLEYSKSGEFEDAPVKEINTAEVLASVVMSLSGAIEEGKAQVTAGPLPVIWGHELSFSRVLQNLIGNAVKYRGKDAPRIHLSATEITEGGGGYWRFTVADNGQGIDPLYQTQIFRLFTRLHGQEYPGVGIGLAACKRIVERGGGRIWVESELGNGAAFHFTLPSERPPEQPLTPKI
jgi:PAS domain S-box-containing protein